MGECLVVLATLTGNKDNGPALAVFFILKRKSTFDEGSHD